MILSVKPQEELRGLLPLKMDEYTVHEVDKTRETLGRAKKSSLDVHGYNLQKPQIG